MVDSGKMKGDMGWKMADTARRKRETAGRRAETGFLNLKIEL